MVKMKSSWGDEVTIGAPPRERKKAPTLCSHCRSQFAGTGPHLVRLLYDAGWRVRFQTGDRPTLLLCPDCQSM